MKSTSLKVLQGIIWRTGYENGDFRGHLYADVAPQLEAWKAEGLQLCVYSLGVGGRAKAAVWLQRCR